MALFENLPKCLHSIVSVDALSGYPNVVTDVDARGQLSRLSIDKIFEEPVTSEPMALCVLSGIWLLHGFLDESHSISQSIDTAEGSWWHAIMHRLEEDFWNAKYWYRRVGQHQLLSSIARQVVEQNLTNDKNGIWNPSRFVDQCEEAARYRTSTKHENAVFNLSHLNQIAQIEWLKLFEYCWSGATDGLK
jgi:hypothetical protein